MGEQGGDGGAEPGSIAGRPQAPPLAVVSAVARVLAGEGDGIERLEALRAQLVKLLPADEVRLTMDRRRSDLLAADGANPALAASTADIPWVGDRIGVLEAVGSTRPPVELRPILETVAALLATVPSVAESGLEVANASLDRALHRMTIDSLPVGLYVVDSDHRIVVWNRKREVGTQGLRRDEVLGRPVFEVLHRQPEAELRSQFKQVFSNGESHVSEQQVNHGGTRKVYRTTRLPMRLDGSTVSHVITIGEDITETREIQLALHRNEKLAAVGQLAAGVMHEINNPLATITACVAAISSRLGTTVEPVVREYLDIIESEVSRCTHIVDGLLDFSRAGRTGEAFEPVGMNDLVERTLFLLKHHQRFRRLSVERELDPNLPEVNGNSERLIQAMMAILLNAADSLGGHGEVRIVTHREGSRAVLEISDDGPGIPEDVLPKVFEPFYTTKGPGRGTGLGLSICYGIVADHHGELDVESVPGETTFRMTVPLAEVAQSGGSG